MSSPPSKFSVTHVVSSSKKGAKHWAWLCKMDGPISGKCDWLRIPNKWMTLCGRDVECRFVSNRGFARKVGHPEAVPTCKVCAKTKIKPLYYD
jgi:hypothetical protein